MDLGLGRGLPTGARGAVLVVTGPSPRGGPAAGRLSIFPRRILDRGEVDASEDDLLRLLADQLQDLV
ncbi:hypothetical protein, partial [Phenylobacterium sp.]|uniref:hypothetical protein n=1 Tax=Phenylobacterium sp. TaxID=1871053 RepID=UPI0025DCA44B